MRRKEIGNLAVLRAELQVAEPVVVEGGAGASFSSRGAVQHVCDAELPDPIRVARVVQVADVKTRRQCDGAVECRLRIAAVRTMGQLGREDDGLLAELLKDATGPMALKLAALDTLSRINLKDATSYGVQFLVSGQNPAEVLAPLLILRKG